jgi:cyanophycinase
MTRRLWIGGVLAVVAALMGSAPRIAVPHLVLVGGALADDNEAVYDALLVRRQSGRIVIVPYASADAAGAAEGMIARFKKRRPDATYLVLPDASKGEAEKKRAAGMIADADLVYFTGGDQSRLIPRFYDGDAPNAVLRALRESMSRSATVVGGSSAGCACMSDPMFTGGASEAALAGLTSRDGEDADVGEPGKGVRLGRGLGLVGGVIMDSHTMQRGRFGRMVAALEQSGKRYAVGVNENRAVICHGGIFTGIGDGAAVVVDIGGMEREGLSRRGVRLSLLGDGDRFGRLSPRTDELVFEPKGPAAARIDYTAPEPDTEPAGAWRRDTLRTLLRRLAADPAHPQRARSERFELVLSADGRTRFGAAPGRPAALSVFDARLDIVELARAPDAPEHGLLIVAPRALAASLEGFVKAKRERLPTRLVTLEEALAGPGADDPERLKRFLYTEWRSGGVGSVLLVGDADVLPVRYMVLDRNTPAAFDYAFYPSDLYYADVAKADGSFDDWNARRDGFHGAYFGEVRGEHFKSDPINSDAIDYRPELAVGRSPVSTPEQAAAVAAKTIAYERALDEGQVPARAGLVCTGGWVDARGQLDAFGARLKGWSLERRYYKDGAFDTPPPTEAEVLSILRSGAGLVLHAGHGSDHVWDGCLGSGSIAGMGNAPAFPVMISAGCSTARFATLPPYEAYEDAAGVEHKGTNDGEVFTAPPPVSIAA